MKQIMKYPFLFSVILLSLISPVAAQAQEKDLVKIAEQPPIPTLAPAPGSPMSYNAPPVAGTMPATAPVASAPAVVAPTPTALPPAADGQLVSPTPMLVSTTKQVKKESIFFTPNQLISIMRANQGFIAPSEAFDTNNQGDKPMDRGPRVVALTGILYHGKNDWTIWLNNERVTPKNIPDRIMGLSVKADRVHVRWMDIGNQRIVNITLRPNQQYLLDSDTIISGSQ